MLFRKTAIPWATLAALVLAGGFTAVILQIIDFPLGVLGDEWPKLHSLRTGAYYYHHPLLMIRAGQISDFFLGHTGLQTGIENSRVCSAVAGGVLVLATFMLARLVLPGLPALAAAAAAAVTPLVSTHARIFKEDIYVAPFLMLGLVALIRLMQDPSPLRTVLLGICTGFAMGSKYVGSLLLPYALGAILLIPAPLWERRFLRAATVTGFALLVFIIVELPAFRHLDRAHRGIAYELNHIVVGHDVALPVWKTLGVYHLSQSLWTGLGPALTLLGLLGLAAPFLAPRERRLPLGLIAGFSILWYAVHEITPLKPHPDFGRYMLVLAPLLSVLAAASLYELLARRDRHGIVATLLVLAAAVPALLTSIRINGTAPDPRAVVPAILDATKARVASDRYAEYITKPTPILGVKVRPTVATADLVATTNLDYDRFDNEAARSDPATQTAAAFYDSLFKLPYLEVSNGRPTYAYFNPVLRIVAIDGDGARLKEIAESIAKAAPDLTIRLNGVGAAESK